MNIIVSQYMIHSIYLYHFIIMGSLGYYRLGAVFGNSTDISDFTDLPIPGTTSWQAFCAKIGSTRSLSMRSWTTRSRQCWNCIVNRLRDHTRSKLGMLKICIDMWQWQLQLSRWCTRLWLWYTMQWYSRDTRVIVVAIVPVIRRTRRVGKWSTTSRWGGE